MTQTTTKESRGKSGNPTKQWTTENSPPAEIKNAIEELKNKKGSWRRRNHGRNLQKSLQAAPLLHVHNIHCMPASRMFPQEMEESQNNPNSQARQRKVQDASKYRPISLINVGGKVLDILLINRVMHHLHSNNLMNSNQYGFTPKRAPHLPN